MQFLERRSSQFRQMIFAASESLPFGARAPFNAGDARHDCILSRVTADGEKRSRLAPTGAGRSPGNTRSVETGGLIVRRPWGLTKESRFLQRWEDVNLRGVLGHIFTDNGREFIATTVYGWIVVVKSAATHIR